MAGRDAGSRGLLRSGIGYAAALVGAIVLGYLVAWVTGAGAPAGLIGTGVAFVVLGYVLCVALPRRGGEEARAYHPTAGHAPAAAAQPIRAPSPAPVSEPPAAAEPAHPGAGISERVREAARAAGEAARAATAAATTPNPAPEPAEAHRPASLPAPREGGADDLKLIKGVGPKLEELLHSLGYFHFDQIAAWTSDEVAWVDSHLEGFNGRAAREDWVGQARILAAGGETEHSQAVARGEVG